MGNLEDNSDKPVTHGDVDRWLGFLIWALIVAGLPIIGVPYAIYWVIKRVVRYFSLEQRYERNPDEHEEEMWRRRESEARVEQGALEDAWRADEKKACEKAGIDFAMDHTYLVDPPDGMAMLSTLHTTPEPTEREQQERRDREQAQRACDAERNRVPVKGLRAPSAIHMELSRRQYIHELEAYNRAHYPTIKLISKTMTPEDISKAQELSKEMLKKNPKLLK